MKIEKSLYAFLTGTILISLPLLVINITGNIGIVEVFLQLFGIA